MLMVKGKITLQLDAGLEHKIDNKGQNIFIISGSFQKIQE